MLKTTFTMISAVMTVGTLAGSARSTRRSCHMGPPCMARDRFKSCTRDERGASSDAKLRERRERTQRAEPGAEEHRVVRDAERQGVGHDQEPGEDEGVGRRAHQRAPLQP